MRTRHLIGLAAVVVGVGACRSARPTAIAVGGDVVNPKTSIYGDWTLSTPPDSASYVGARSVDLSLRPGTFTITVYYPGEAPLTITGDASLWADSLRLTLNPRNLEAVTGSLTRPSPFKVGQPVTVIASAAGRTLVFSRTAESNPSSVWFRRGSGPTP